MKKQHGGQSFLWAQHELQPAQPTASAVCTGDVTRGLQPVDHSSRPQLANGLAGKLISTAEYTAVRFAIDRPDSG